MVLWHIENTEFKKVETTLKDSSKIHLEHVLPRNPAEGWKKVFANDEKKMGDYKYRFGNYTLLYGRLNQKARNSVFQEKLKEYAKSEVGLTKETLSIKEWNETTIDKRTELLFERTQKIWPIYK